MLECSKNNIVSQEAIAELALIFLPYSDIFDQLFNFKGTKNV